MAEPLVTEWTDEKHRLYLSSMEASFVKQLYNLGSRSTDLLGGRERNKLDLNSSRRSNAISSSGQFKVLRGGSWQKINFERAQPQLDIADETHALPNNQWIQHFRSGDKQREVSSASLKDGCAHSSHATYVREQKMVSCGVTTSSIHFSAGHKRLYHQDSIESNTEVSDQNFDDEDYKKAPISIKCKTKRKKTAVTSNSAKDQVVPSGKSLITNDPDEKCGFVETQAADVLSLGQS
ncbi:hypothetical protein C5167_016860 [Papaver somniferum]|uniref:Uncharacterized protein n=1 Tax=Papaver somniferum TaxID=3469 RepID=A0A4Y7ILV3_PAPSO|nr:uncharacterized protein LOC113346652 [Papaver somniferum]XP_026445915.1 uncharacterized protein LOC113346652 [Papaver somniferum]RZC48435.1 hypothetical protein C5167_016860 [Papaver somniferum]